MFEKNWNYVFLHRKMHQSGLFPNMCRFLQNDPIFTDLSMKNSTIPLGSASLGHLLCVVK